MGNDKNMPPNPSLIRTLLFDKPSDKVLMYVNNTENSENCVIRASLIAKRLQSELNYKNFMRVNGLSFAGIAVDQGEDPRNVFSAAYRNFKRDIQKITESYSCYDETSMRDINNQNTRYRNDL